MCTARWGKMKQAWQIFDNVDKLYSDLVFKKETSLFKVCLANTFSKKRTFQRYDYGENDDDDDDGVNEDGREIDKLTYTYEGKEWRAKMSLKCLQISAFY